jgi:hypothetical protein
MVTSVVNGSEALVGGVDADSNHVRAVEQQKSGLHNVAPLETFLFGRELLLDGDVSERVKNLKDERSDDEQFSEPFHFSSPWLCAVYSNVGYDNSDRERGVHRFGGDWSIPSCSGRSESLEPELSSWIQSTDLEYGCQG